MSYFLSDKPLRIGEIIELTGDEARHILLSRRIEIGEIIEIQEPAPSNVEDPGPKRFEAEVVEIGKRSVALQILEEIETPKESKLKITIFQALIKEQPLDFIIQKATELGVGSLVLFNSQNSIERFKDMEKKLARWRKVGVEAAKQSGRVQAVKIEYADKIGKIHKKIGELDQTFLLEPKSKTKFSIWEPSSQINKIGILVGPEGGFTEDEVEEFEKFVPDGKKVIPISMGPRILRADTAAIASSAIIQALWGDI